MDTEGGVKTPGMSWRWSRLPDELAMRDAELRTMFHFGYGMLFSETVKTESVGIEWY